MQLEKTSKKKQPGLIPPPFPDILNYIWSWYNELAGARGSGGFGPLPIAFAEIYAWSRLMGIDISPWEVVLIRKIDVKFVGALQKKDA